MGDNVRARQVSEALSEPEADSSADCPAGGTTQLDLMKDGVWRTR
ncbi:hypothetical protein [Streptomyces milbemycinicus]|uniref:Uncharacterized protein n=1 Tax=Streptomyces milbemycinicus TaxID=476552 RepID=A0ABW8M1Y5_9ACTN